jgi:hypothetical protein
VLIVHIAPNVPAAAASTDASISRPPPSPHPEQCPPLLPLVDPLVLPTEPELLPLDEPLLDVVLPPEPPPELELPEPDDVESVPVVEPVLSPLHPATRSAATTADDSRDPRARVFMRVPLVEQPPCERNDVTPGLQSPPTTRNHAAAHMRAGSIFAHRWCTIPAGWHRAPCRAKGMA